MAMSGAGARAAQRLGGLRLMMLSGDWIPLSLPERLRAVAPGAIHYSLGGATEVSIWSICYRINDADPGWRSIPYGKPLRNQTFHVLKSDLTPCPVYGPRKLFIRGERLALCDLPAPQKTAPRALAHQPPAPRLCATCDIS